MPLNIQAARGGVAACHGLAIITTSFRLIHRLRVRRLWWDDFWALVAVIGIVPLMTTSLVWPIPTNVTSAIYILWRMSALIFYTLCLWTARLSVAVTIVRLLPEGYPRRVAKAVSVVFGLVCLALVLQKIFMCGLNINPKTFARCDIPKWTAFMELSSDLTADIWLIFAPVYMLLQMKLPRSHRRLIIYIFACGIFTTAASVVHCTFIFLNLYRETGTSGNIQAAISVIVCNLLVVVTFIYRVFRDNEESDEETDSESCSAPLSNSGPVGSIAATSAVPMSNITFTEISESFRSTDDSGLMLSTSSPDILSPSAGTNSNSFPTFSAISGANTAPAPSTSTEHSEEITSQFESQITSSY